MTSRWSRVDDPEAGAPELYRRSIEIVRARGLGSGAAQLHSLGDLSLDNGDPTAADR